MGIIGLGYRLHPNFVVVIGEERVQYDRTQGISLWLGGHLSGGRG